MNAEVLTYESIKEWKNKKIVEFKNDLQGLNAFHDEIMRKVLQVAIVKLNKGMPPCNFSWFVTGSAGRLEQGFISDQDHGMIYEVDTQQCRNYFLALGEELSNGLEIVGYPYCKGDIMSFNPLWSKSIYGWKKQLVDWMKSESWETIRYLQIFYDSRVLEGEVRYLNRLKSVIYEYQMVNPDLLIRLMANIMHVKNIIGPLGQILTERYGKYQGCIDIKYSAFVPYVNAVRLLAIKEGIYETSTLIRMAHLIQRKEYRNLLQDCEKNFQRLLSYRISLYTVDDYFDTHYLKLGGLKKEEKKELKKILKTAIKLHADVIELLEKGAKNGF